MDNRNPLLMDLRERHVQLEARLDRFMVQMDRRFEQIDRRFANIDARIDRLDRKIDAQGLKKMGSQSYGLTGVIPMPLWWFAGIMLTGSVAVVAAILSQ